MRLLLLLVVFAVGACDSVPGYAAPSGFVEGSFTLADGTSESFRHPAFAGASRYSGLGTRDQFSFGTTRLTAREPQRISLTFTQGGLAPVAGSFAWPASDPGTLGMGVSYSIADASIEDRDGRPDTVDVVAYFPEHTVEVRVADGVISGEFEVVGRPINSEENSLGSSVRGRFEIGYEPYRE